MPPAFPSARRRARDAARAASLCCAAMLAVTLVSGSSSGAEEAGPAQIVVPISGPDGGLPLASGGSATTFSLALPAGAGCTGDTATGGYLVQTYIVPSTVDPGVLTFGAAGPIPTGSGATLRRPLYSGTTPVVNRPTDLAPGAGQPGPIVGLPAFSFAVYGAAGPTVIPPGLYNLGVACSLDGALDKFWNVQVSFAADPTDTPSGITWTTVDVGTTTTTEGSTTTGDPGTTTTTSGATTTTTSGATTTTTTAATTTTTGDTTTTSEATTTTLDTTTTTGAEATSTTALGSVPTFELEVLGDGAVRPSGGSSSLPVTGTDLSVALWGTLLVIFGVVAVRLGRGIDGDSTDGSAP